MNKLLFSTILVASFLIGCTQENENFDDFLFKFGSDQDFQLERIDFPLRLITWENQFGAGFPGHCDPSDISVPVDIRLLHSIDCFNCRLM